MDQAQVQTTSSVTSENSITNPGSTFSPSPAPSSTPQPTEEPTIPAPLQISSFEVIEDFSQSFVLSDWADPDSIDTELFTFENQDGILDLSITMAHYGPASLFLQTPVERLPEGMNSIAVEMPRVENRFRSSIAGLQVGLTDGTETESFRFGIVTLGSTSYLQCYIHSYNGQMTHRDIALLLVPAYQTHDLKISWIPDSGLVLFFLNNQLVGHHQADLSGSFAPYETGLFADRWNEGDSGTFRFANLKAGSYQEHTLALPDDLIPVRGDTLVSSTDNLDYYLFDAFESPAADGLGNYNLFVFPLPGDGETVGPPSELVYRQENGRMWFSGEGDALIYLPDMPETLRAIQANFQSDGSAPFKGTFQLQLAARSGFPDEPRLEYVCNLDYDGSPWATAGCFVMNWRNNQFVHQAGNWVFHADEPVAFELTYNEVLGQFETYINNTLVNEAVLGANELAIIEENRMLPGMSVMSSSSGAISMDNFQAGLQKEEITQSPEEELSPAEMIASLPHSDLFLYDDLQNPDYEGFWDLTRWQAQIFDDDGPRPARLMQLDGALVVKTLEDDEIGAWSLSPLEFYGVTPEQANAIQLTIRGEPGHSYQTDTSLLLGMNAMRPVPLQERMSNYGTMASKNNSFSCRYGLRGSFAFFGCECFGESSCQGYQSGEMWLDPDQPHQIALEYEAAEEMAYAYVDGLQVAGAYYPLEYIGFYLEPGVEEHFQMQDCLFVENILIGTPANHPELLDTLGYPGQNDPEVDFSVVSSLPHSDLFLYDDFEDEAYDRFWNLSHWQAEPSDNPDHRYGFAQENGALVMQPENVDHTKIWQLVPDPQKIFSPQEVNAVQFTIRGEANHTYTSETGINISLHPLHEVDQTNSQDGTYWEPVDEMGGFDCNYYFIENELILEFHCDNQAVCGDFSFDPITLDPDQPHQVALEYDQREQLVYAYIDGARAVGTHFQVERFQFEVHANGRAADPSNRVYIDEVQLGTPAEHPELVPTE